MGGRHQPLNGADSADGLRMLATTDRPDLRQRADVVRERLTLVTAAEGTSTRRALSAFALGYLVAGARRAVAVAASDPSSAIEQLREDLEFVEYLQDSSA